MSSLSLAFAAKLTGGTGNEIKVRISNASAVNLIKKIGKPRKITRNIKVKILLFIMSYYKFSKLLKHQKRQTKPSDPLVIDAFVKYLRS